MQGYDVMEEMYNAKTAAMNFVQEVCKVRAKGNLPDFMTVCIGAMTEYKVGMFAVVPSTLVISLSAAWAAYCLHSA